MHTHLNTHTQTETDIHTDEWQMVDQSGMGKVRGKRRGNFSPAVVDPIRRTGDP